MDTDFVEYEADEVTSLAQEVYVVGLDLDAIFSVFHEQVFRGVGKLLDHVQLKSRRAPLQGMKKPENQVQNLGIGLATL